MKRSVLVSPVLLTAILLASVCNPVLAQNVRPPGLNIEYHRAETAWKSGASVLEAKARVDRVLRELPDDAEARKLRAQVLLSMERSQEALIDARRAVELNPSDGEAHLVLSEAARLAGELDLARESLDRAAERLLDDPVAHVRLSWNAVALDEMDRAEAYARTALALDATQPTAYYQLARVFILRNRPDAAVETLARGLRGSIVDLETVERDPVLSRVARHPQLIEYARR